MNLPVEVDVAKKQSMPIFCSSTQHPLESQINGINQMRENYYG